MSPLDNSVLIHSAQAFVQGFTVADVIHNLLGAGADGTDGL
jgi:hypothetical protein